MSNPGGGGVPNGSAAGQVPIWDGTKWVAGAAPGGLAHGPRTLFADDCMAAALPAGVTAAGNGFDNVRKTRTIAGGGSYQTPVIALYGVITFIVDFEPVAAPVAGSDLQITLRREDNLHTLFWKSQGSDGNDFLWPMTGGAALFSKGSSLATQGSRLRCAMSLSDAFEPGMSATQSTAYVNIAPGFEPAQGEDYVNLAPFGRYVVGEAVPQGTNLTLLVATTGTRTVALHSVYAYQGLGAPV